MHLLHKIKKIIRNIKIREKMILIFFIGGILPMLTVILYNNHAAKKMLVRQTMESEAAELTLLGDAIYENIRIVSDVSKRLYFDRTIEKIAFTKYNSYEEILKDYNSYTKITDCLNDYYQEISYIKVYIENPTIVNSANFIKVEESTRQEEWYQKTLLAKGNVYWSFINDSLTKKKCLRLSRVLYTREMKQVGVLSIAMQNKRTELPIANRKKQTLLLYNNKEVVHSNFRETNYFQIIDIIREHAEKKFYGKVIYKGKECFLVLVRIQPDFSNNYFTIASISPYADIIRSVNRTSMTEFLPFFACIILAVLFILALSEQFSRQINQFRETMHQASIGNFNIVKHLEGKDELSMLYEDLNVMIRDIQLLMDEVVAEQVQKEKLNSRQKEVEFKMLASQINPHFLYNTLETIRMKAIMNKQTEIAELVFMLAKIMRRNIQVGEQLVTLDSELKLVEYYLKIQRYRFSDRIQYEMIVNEDVNKEYMIMPLIIQPLVENAFVHGLESVEEDGKLTIRVSLENQAITIKVMDNGKGIAPERLAQIRHSLNDFETLDRTHIGVSNVNQRIKLQYGEKYGLNIESEEGNGTTVMLTIPVCF